MSAPCAFCAGDRRALHSEGCAVRARILAHRRPPISTTLLGRERYHPPDWARFTVTIAYNLTADLQPSWSAGSAAPVQCFTSLVRARTFAIQAMRRAPIVTWPDGCPTVWALLTALPINRAAGDRRVGRLLGICFQSWDAGGTEVKCHPIPAGYHGSR